MGSDKEQAVVFDGVFAAGDDGDILHGVSFSLARGEKAALTGPSGAGKSTVLAAMLGFRPPRAGSIWVHGMELTEGTVGAIRRSLTFVFQEPVLGADTVREALLLPFSFRAYRGARPSEAVLARALADVALSPAILQKRTDVLSGGEKQRLALARGLLLGHSLCVLDEISSALDAASKATVYQTLSRPELTVLAVSHDAAWLDRCDRIITLTEGHVRPPAPVTAPAHC